jgi:hypothetical protein
MLRTDSQRSHILTAFEDFNTQKRHSLHRLNLLRRLGLLDNVRGLDFQRAVSYENLKEAYSLNYRIFLMNKYLAPHFLGMRIREWELSPATATFTARHDNKAVGVISLVHPIPGLGLPSEQLFPDEIHELKQHSGYCIEACNGATDEFHRDMSITIEFFRCLIAYCWNYHIDHFVGITNKNHKTFYEFVYMFQIGEEKSYSKEFNDPVVLMCLDCNRLYDYLSSPESDNGTADSYLRDYLLFKNPYIALAAGWEKKARAAFKRQRIGERFQDEIRNTLVASVLDEMQKAKSEIPAGSLPE